MASPSEHQWAMRSADIIFAVAARDSVEKIGVLADWYFDDAKVSSSSRLFHGSVVSPT
jgi:hypothetical protein